MKNRKNKIKEDIIRKIEKDEVKMRPKWIFLAKSGGLKGAWILMLAAAGIGLWAFIYFVRIYNPAMLIEFGEVGRQLFWEDFPYSWLGTGVIAAGAGILLLTQIGDNYKKETKYLVLTVAIIVMLLAAAAEIIRELLEL